MRIQCLIILLSLSSITVIAQEKRVTLLFAGDAMQHMPQFYAANTDSGYNYAPVFQFVKNHISQFDIAGVNFETTLGGAPYKGYPQFSSPNEFATALYDAGFNFFFTANNHSLDTGKRGLEQTIEFIKELGAKQTGTFKSLERRELTYPLMIIKNGIRIAFLNYTYGTNDIQVEEPNIVNIIDTLLIKKDLKSAELLKPDIMIAVMHWGEEYHTKPSKSQKKIAQFLLDNKVRIVIGHHPHVIQPIQTTKLNDRIINTVFYSLGNFISNQRKPDTDGGMIAEIVLSKAKDEAFVNIESVDYSLVWVHKIFKSGKAVYHILPIDKDDENYQKDFTLTPYEHLMLKGFVDRAIKTANAPL